MQSFWESAMTATQQSYWSWWLWKGNMHEQQVNNDCYPPDCCQSAAPPVLTAFQKNWAGAGCCCMTTCTLAGYADPQMTLVNHEASSGLWETKTFNLSVSGTSISSIPTPNLILATKKNTKQLILNALTRQNNMLVFCIVAFFQVTHGQTDDYFTGKMMEELKK